MSDDTLTDDAPNNPSTALRMPEYIKPKKKTEAEYELASEEAKLGVKLSVLKERKKELAEAEKANNKEIEETEFQLATLLQEKSVDLFRVPGLGTFSVTGKLCVSVLAADRDSLIQWLDENGHGSIAKRTIHHGTLTSWVAEEMEANNPLPPQVKTFTAAKINFTAPRTKK